MTTMGYATNGNGSLIKVRLNNGRVIRAKLRRDYKEKDDGIFWLLQPCTCIVNNYTEKDLIERRTYELADTISDGDVVEVMLIDADASKLVETANYRVNVIGDYLNCAVLEKIF